MVARPTTSRGLPLQGEECRMTTPNKGKAAVIETCGTVRAIDWEYPPPDEGHFVVLYREMHCDRVQAVPMYPDESELPSLVEIVLWVDPESKINGADFNPVATGVATHLYRSLKDNDYIAGVAVFTGTYDNNGVLPLPTEVLELLVSIKFVEVDD